MSKKIMLKLCQTKPDECISIRCNQINCQHTFFRSRGQRDVEIRHECGANENMVFHITIFNHVNGLYSRKCYHVYPSNKECTPTNCEHTISSVNAKLMNPRVVEELQNRAILYNNISDDNRLNYTLTIPSVGKTDLGLNVYKFPSCIPGVVKHMVLSVRSCLKVQKRLFWGLLATSYRIAAHWLMPQPDPFNAMNTKKRNVAICSLALNVLISGGFYATEFEDAIDDCWMTIPNGIIRHDCEDKAMLVARVICAIKYLEPFSQQITNEIAKPMREFLNEYTPLIAFSVVGGGRGRMKNMNRKFDNYRDINNAVNIGTDAHCFNLLIRNDIFQGGRVGDSDEIPRSIVIDGITKTHHAFAKRNTHTPTVWFRAELRTSVYRSIAVVINFTAGDNQELFVCNAKGIAGVTLQDIDEGKCTWNPIVRCNHDEKYFEETYKLLPAMQWPNNLKHNIGHIKKNKKLGYRTILTCLMPQSLCVGQCLRSKWRELESMRGHDMWYKDLAENNDYEVVDTLYLIDRIHLVESKV